MKNNNIVNSFRGLRGLLAAGVVVALAGFSPSVLAEGIIVQGSVTAESPVSQPASAAVTAVVPLVGERGPTEQGVGPMGGGAPVTTQGSMDEMDDSHWDCQRIGGGLEYCEPGVLEDEEDEEGETPQGQGREPVVGAEGVPHSGHDMAFADAGCNTGGSAPGTGLVFGLLFMVAGFLRRR